MIPAAAYASTAAYFGLSYGLSLWSLFHSRWLVVAAPKPFTSEIAYGLLVRCTASHGCRAFPQEDLGDCGHDVGQSLHGTVLSSVDNDNPGYGPGFCGAWRAARFAAIAAAVIGVLVLVELAGTLLAKSYARRARSWKVVATLLSTHAICLVFATLIISDLASKSALFYFDTSYGTGYWLTYASWIMEGCGVLALMAFALYARRFPVYEVV
ncbi:hypothetical protein THASP1DRAFT_27620 [Thamnocephalis sphaerospora]|uniref:Uncharacterized protein n=1 Tax=Thamnocephalis sphaerospora TaxID=78915 RepID=A0A4P9XWB4_9FUNG|nr:hypothetical protein THASP1DRAFT_27620 [Thamnocephalis sphaerospora]|eukprot:RKP10607.1 hypothetical protein THASP1DRAFT_27620 [Thamnocephalis sphaerospora]